MQRVSFHLSMFMNPRQWAKDPLPEKILTVGEMPANIIKRFGYNNNVYGSSGGSFAVGPNDWDVSVTWDLGELIYNGDQTLIDVRSKLMVQLRNDILSEVTSLYFERRKLQIELLTNKELECARRRSGLFFRHAICYRRWTWWRM